MKRTVRIVAILLIVAALIGAAAFFLLRQGRNAEADSAPAIITVTRGAIQETVSAAGNAAAERQVTLTFASSGKISEVAVERGQRVAAGQVLARLDTGTLEWQIARAQAALDITKARFVQAQQPAGQEEIASAQAALDSARANLERTQAGPTAEELASAQAALDSAQANYKKVAAGPTKEDLAAAQAAVESARAALRQAQAGYDQVKNRPDVQMLPQSLTLQNATIELERAQANYQALANRPTASELAAARAQVAQAESQLTLLRNRPSPSELAAAEAQVIQAETQLTQLRERPNTEDLAVFQAQVDESTIALEQVRSQLEDAAIVAPFEGLILELRAQEGEWASPGAPAAVLAATDRMLLQANVEEVDVAKLAEGQVAHLSFDALEDVQIDGVLTRIAPSATNIQGAVAYPVEIEFIPGEVPVRLGMTANVEIVVAEADDALLVSTRAIESDRAAGRYYVTRQVAAGTTERVEVRIGLRDGTQTQILEGLNEGDELVLSQVPAPSTGSGPFGGRGPFGEGMGGGQ